MGSDTKWTLTRAKKWLNAVRHEGRIQDTVHFLIAQHALECPCRLFTEEKIKNLIYEGRNAHAIDNRDPSAKDNSFKVCITDSDPNLEENRRKVELTILFSWKCPEVISAWRSGSPHSNDPNAPPCKLNPTQPPCKMQKPRRPRGKI